MQHARGFLSIVILVVMAGGFSNPAVADVRIFLDAESVEGDSTEFQHEGWMEIDGFELDLDRPVAIEIGESTERGDHTFAPLRIWKRVDKASPQLAQSMRPRREMDHVFLNVVEPGPEEQVVVLSYSFGPAFVTNMEWVGMAEGGELREVVTIEFEAYRMAFRELEQDGTPLPPIVTGWNQVTQAAEPLPPAAPGTQADVPVMDTISINGPSDSAAQSASDEVAREEDAASVDE